MQKSLASIGLIALLAIPTFLIITLQRSSDAHTLAVGEPIPGLILGDTGSGKWSLAAPHGKRAAILFFSVDCPHCQREIATFNEAQKALWADVEFIAVSLSGQQKTCAFVRGNRTSARVLIDEKGAAGRSFGISELPALFLVSEDRKIQRVSIGEQTRGTLLRRLFVFEGKTLDVSAHNGNETGEK